MKTTRLYFLLGLLCTSTSLMYSQGIKGKITDDKNNPLPFASIFVTNNGTGTTTNENGDYDLRLSPGDYKIVFQYLGYETKVEKISIGDSYRTFDIKLPEKPIDLKTVDIYEGREDPAYTVMRKAIAKASYHRQQLDHYECEIYIKGTGRLKNIPRIVRKRLEREGVDTSAAYTSESVSKFEYTRPNTYKETVISVYESGEGYSTSPNAFINGSFYEPELVEAISPLSPRAFAYYKFKLEGFFLDRGFGVNKIKVTPRSRGESVFEGYIYIVEDYWSIYSTSLKTYRFGIAFQIDQTYAPIQESVWLPVSHKFEVSGKILGFAFIFDYLATVSDYKIELNPDLEEDFQLIDEKLDKEQAKQIAQAAKEDEQEGSSALERLSSGKELTRKELRKIIREYEKEEQKEQEEPEVVSNYTFKVDSTSRRKDSTYWAEIRPVPLTEFEVLGYERADSIALEDKKKQEEYEKEPKDSTSGKKKSRWRLSNIISGNSYKLGEGTYFSHSTFFDKILFNPVEGFSLHNNLKYSQKKKEKVLTIVATPRYAFARETFSMKGDIRYKYGKRLKRNSIWLGGGRYIFQYNEDRPIDMHVNAFINLFYHRNYISLYEKDYLQLGADLSVSQNVKVRPLAEFANRYELFNATSQSWFPREGRAYDPNVPLNEERETPILDEQKAMLLGVEVEAKPWQKYRIENGRKVPISTSSPTLLFHYKKGVNGLLDSEVNFDLFEVTFISKFNIGAKGLVNVKANTGIFFNDNNLGFVDFKHFMGNRLPFVTTDPVGSFRLLEYYRYSTADKFLALHAHYQFRKFLVTQFPEAWLIGMKENLFVNYLATPTSDNYVELGYSIDNIFRIFRVEAAFSFQDGKYRDFGVLIGIASNLEDIFN